MCILAIRYHLNTKLIIFLQLTLFPCLEMNFANQIGNPTSSQEQLCVEALGSHAPIVSWIGPSSSSVSWQLPQLFEAQAVNHLHMLLTPD